MERCLVSTHSADFCVEFRHCRRRGSGSISNPDEAAIVVTVNTIGMGKSQLRKEVFTRKRS